MFCCRKEVGLAEAGQSEAAAGVESLVAAVDDDNVERGRGVELRLCNAET